MKISTLFGGSTSTVTLGLAATAGIWSYSLYFHLSASSSLDARSIFIFWCWYLILAAAAHAVAGFSRFREYRRGHLRRQDIPLVTISAVVGVTYLADVLANRPTQEQATTNLTQLGEFNPDSVFNAAMLQSLMAGRSTSTGLHGDVPVPYHFLSYLFDIPPLLATGLSPFEASSLLSGLHATLLVNVVIIGVLFAVRKINVSSFVVLALAGLPVIFGDWKFVSSHSFMAATLITFTFLPLLYRWTKMRELRWDSLVLASILILSVSLAKFPFGFILAAFIGFFWLLRFPRQLKLYVVGVFWAIALLLIYRELSSAGTYSPSNFGIERVIAFLHPGIHETYIGGQPGNHDGHLMVIYSAILIQISLGFIYQSRRHFQIAGAALIGILTVAIITQVFATSLFPSGVRWFVMGVSVPVTVLTVIDLLALSAKPRGELKGRSFIPRKLLFPALTLSAVFLTHFGPLTSVNLFTEVERGGPIYAGVSKNVTSLARSIGATGESYYGAKVAEYADSMRSFAAEQDPQVTLYQHISITEFEGFLSNLSGPSWARGMLLYALTGIPLVNGVEDNSMSAFLMSSYPDEARWSRNPCYTGTAKVENILVVEVIFGDDITIRPVPENCVSGPQE